MCSADVCVFVFRIQCVWCVCDVLYLIYLRHIEKLFRSHWSYDTWLLSCHVSKIFVFCLLIFVSLENIVYIGHLCIEYLFCKHPKDEHSIPS